MQWACIACKQLSCSKHQAWIVALQQCSVAFLPYLSCGMMHSICTASSNPGGIFGLELKDASLCQQLLRRDKRWAFSSFFEQMLKSTLSKAISHMVQCKLSYAFACMESNDVSLGLCKYCKPLKKIPPWVIWIESACLLPGSLYLGPPKKNVEPLNFWWDCDLSMKDPARMMRQGCNAWTAYC